MLQLDYKSGVPICEQIVNGFIRLKALGVLNGGDQLPSVRSLAIKLSVNPNTIQKAYAILESDGVIYSVKGKGSYMAEGSSSDLAVIKKAKENFKQAVTSANQLGLTNLELKELVDEVLKEEAE
ncbi:MAG: GntR family transcriptional regulator [Clostridia bacterium]|nr:GntR family transcriptional regulator [Clostridia bacterium]